MASQNISVTIDENLYIGDYEDIKIKVKEILERIGQSFRWTIIESSYSVVKFKTPISFRSFGETVVVNYSSNTIYISSTANQQKTLTTWGKNAENCNRYLSQVVPSVQNYFTQKESLRQQENIIFIDDIRRATKLISIDNSILETITKNQNKFEQNLISNLLKIHQYYSDQIKTHNVIYENISSMNFHKMHNRTIDSAAESIKVFSSGINLLELVIIKMLVYYLEDDLINFYILYNKFENLGLFLSKGEKLIITGLNDINKNIDYLISGIETMIHNISDLSSHLNDINNNIRYSNIMQTINAYQIYRLKSQQKNRD